MKLKHNKKRNTAFLFESLIRELTKSSLKGNITRKKKVLHLIKEFFNKSTILYAELQLYKTLCENTELDNKTAEKILQETKERHTKLNKKLIFNDQSRLIKKINEVLGKDIFDNFIPNYRNLATTYQILYKKDNVKKQIHLEERVIKRLQSQSSELEEQKYKPISKLAFKNFFNKFNDTYKNSLLSEQKQLIQCYINSFEHDELEFKIFLNEEIGRLKETFGTVSKDNSDSLIIEKKEQILKILDSFKNKDIDSNILEKVLKLQQVAEEITNNGD